MRNRCSNPKSQAWKDYGGRGIRVCARWDSFAAFAEDMGERPSKAHSIERIHNDRGYEPDNCRWATKTEQSRNTRRNLLVTIRGGTMVLSEAAADSPVHYNTIWGRLRKGWDHERAVSAPAGGRKARKFLCESDSEAMKEAIDYLLHGRLRSG